MALPLLLSIVLIVIPQTQAAIIARSYGAFRFDSSTRRSNGTVRVIYRDETMKAQYLPGKAASTTIIALFLLSVVCISTAWADADERVTESTHYSSGGRDTREAIKTQRDTHASTAIDKQKPRVGGKPGQSSVQAVGNDFWVFDADVVLFADEDLDGFYSGIDLLFDVDTVFTSADVYAVLYLSLEGGPWEEYAVTETFTIFGQSDNDDYSVVTDLVSGYPTGSYDLLIEVFDAFNDEFVAFLAPEDTSALALLPLEDIARDTPPGATTVVVNTEGGGSLGWLMLLLLPGLAGLMRLRRPG
ncbi:MAG: choice-of-anchor H family protein [Pseudomonadota bacterium]